MPFHRGTNAGLFVWANFGIAWLQQRDNNARCQQHGTIRRVSCIEDQVTVDFVEIQNRSQHQN